MIKESSLPKAQVAVAQAGGGRSGTGENRGTSGGGSGDDPGGSGGDGGQHNQEDQPSCDFLSAVSFQDAQGETQNVEMRADIVTKVIIMLCLVHLLIPF